MHIEARKLSAEENGQNDQPQTTLRDDSDLLPTADILHVPICFTPSPILFFAFIFLDDVFRFTL